ncbi:hypothetical protein FOZ60_000333, partial [Perkinsus olseni]
SAVTTTGGQVALIAAIIVTTGMVHVTDGGRFSLVSLRSHTRRPLLAVLEAATDVSLYRLFVSGPCFGTELLIEKMSIVTDGQRFREGYLAFWQASELRSIPSVIRAEGYNSA